MNRDELLEVCFGAGARRSGSRIVEATDGGDVVAHLDLGYKRVLVRPPTLPGPGVSVASLTIHVATISYLCVDPARRGEGHARRLVELVHEEVGKHPLVRFAAAFATDGRLLEQLGYLRVDEAGHPRLLVRSLDGSEWPAGRLDTRGEW